MGGIIAARLLMVKFRNAIPKFLYSHSIVSRSQSAITKPHGTLKQARLFKRGARCFLHITFPMPIGARLVRGNFEVASHDTLVNRVEPALRRVDANGSPARKQRYLEILVVHRRRRQLRSPHSRRKPRRRLLTFDGRKLTGALRFSRGALRFSMAHSNNQANFLARYHNGTRFLARAQRTPARIEPHILRNKHNFLAPIANSPVDGHPRRIGRLGAINHECDMRKAPANQTETRNHIENLRVVAYKLNIKAAFACTFLHNNTKCVEFGLRKGPFVIFAHGMTLSNRFNGNHAPVPFRRAASLSPFYATTHGEVPRSIISSKSTSWDTREGIRRTAQALHGAHRQTTLPPSAKNKQRGRNRQDFSPHFQPTIPYNSLFYQSCFRR